MDNKKDMKKNKQGEENIEDVEIPSLDEQIDTWCAVPEQNDESKNAGDLEVDAWCENTTVEDKEKKKDKEQG